MDKAQACIRGALLVMAAVAAVQLSTPARAQGIFAGRHHHYANSLAPYVVSPQQVVDRMLEIAELKPGETLYDLGSGDGRILITAAQRFHAKAVGIEISEALVRRSQDMVSRLGLRQVVHIIHGDIREADFSPADVVTMYLMTGSNETLRPRLERSLHAGARVVSHDYAVPGWKPNRVEEADVHKHGHLIYLYVMPAKR